MPKKVFAFLVLTAVCAACFVAAGWGGYAGVNTYINAGSISLAGGAADKNVTADISNDSAPLTINMGVKYMSDGKMEQTVDITFNTGAILAAGLNSGFAGDVSALLWSQMQQKDKDYQSAYKQLDSAVSGDFDLRLKAAVLYSANGVDTRTIANGFEIYKDFGNMYAFMYYNYGTVLDNKFLNDVPLDGVLTVGQNSFLTIYTQDCKTLYDASGAPQKYAGTTVGFVPIVNLIISAVNSAGAGKILFDDAALQFSFSTPYGRVHSDGTESQSGRYYVHTWAVLNTDLSMPITITRVGANSGMWYVLALGLTLVFVLGLAAIIVLQPRSKKRKVQLSPQELARMLDELNSGTAKMNDEQVNDYLNKSISSNENSGTNKAAENAKTDAQKPKPARIRKPKKTEAEKLMDMLDEINKKK